MTLEGTNVLVAPRGEHPKVIHTTHPVESFVTGNLGKDYNMLMDRVMGSDIDWVVTGSHHVVAGTLVKFPRTPISMIQVSMQQEDGSFTPPEDASVWIIHKSAFHLRHSELFPCYWEDYHMVYNVWWHLPYSVNPPDCGLTVWHPYHPKREDSLLTAPAGQEHFRRLFREKHNCDFFDLPQIDVWRSSRPARLDALLASR